MAENNEFDAAKKAVEALEGLNAEAQERALRWVADKLNISSPPTNKMTTVVSATTQASTQNEQSAKQDIKSFVNSKNPRSDVHFAATVAYYYQFEAPLSEKKEQINADDLQDACRKVVRPRLKDPNKTLNNALAMGVLDRKEKGAYALNSVGENLVAMVLPSNALGRSTKAGAKKKS